MNAGQPFDGRSYVVDTSAWARPVRRAAGVEWSAAMALGQLWITPVVKLSTNTKLAQRMSDIIDIDTGPVIEGASSIEAMRDSILELMIEVASGSKQTKAESLRQDDFIPWKRGVSL